MIGRNRQTVESKLVFRELGNNFKIQIQVESELSQAEGAKRVTSRAITKFT